MTPQELEFIYGSETPDVARTRIEPLANGGNPIAQFYMGHLCDEAGDETSAVNWYRKASNSDYLPAKHFLASFMYYGLGTDQDVPRALLLFREAAERGYADSQCRLGLYLLESADTRAEALTWLRKARSQGHMAAIQTLAKEGDSALMRRSAPGRADDR